ncbi:putative cyclin-dependent serine/threonine-protein kinase DDB_G0272797/DDB_G0274007 isoform X2 [Diaphorina citri]|uniref:Cyclin-dependent serine/threonine-protein kinase DDB_G0272797/DDB_G0274007 isoform X1 n=1 Tax=Diaphorina citri TaxID=121845 RepID=A0A3Q0ISL7_DIACI|nr:putative cyclin-dependent serine/threonine-protein kinase DDB_G0272797/DDB_G0274007 isoform X1 [Diaphorina citri]XP_026679265.1 putative cyclin-dependent serine/threonine-protein kinase DDB_G0272797/DDB_G0274007 isoform X2 [Diaphorina citri]
MYSHELQTCDWPRNVGCDGVASVFTDEEPIQSPQRSKPLPSLPQQQIQNAPPRIPPRQRDELLTKPLYEEEELGPAEEIESDRQQRVYRGQPPTLGQVARDRDGIAKHANALQTSPGVKQHVPFQYRTSVAPQQGPQQVYLQQSASPAPSYNYSSAINQFSQQQQPQKPQQQRPQQQFDTSYYNLYDDDDFYREDDYAQQFQNQNRGKIRDQGNAQISQQREQQKQQQQQNNVYNAAAQDYNEQYHLQSPEQDNRYEQPTKSPVVNSRGRVRGSATYTTASPDAERGDKPGSRSRPTLKPSQSIVAKAAASEAIDIYKFPPSRPESVYPTPQPDKTAAKCRKDVCLLPDCYCGGKDVPGKLPLLLIS